MSGMSSTLDPGGKITLDHETFKVLASETRVGILKRLDKTQLTVSDLARLLDMSKATLFEHLEKLQQVGLIKKKESERKWVYYKLTWKGKNILHPERTKIAIVLTVFIFLFLIPSVFYVYYSIDAIELKSDEDAMTSAPNIMFSNVEDITKTSVVPNEFNINITSDYELDNAEVSVQYKIHEDYVADIEQITDWQKLPSTIEVTESGLLLTVAFPDLVWSEHTGEFLYIKCTIEDDRGYLAKNYYIEYIEETFRNSTELSISKTDVQLGPDFRSKKLTGFQNVPLIIRVHNLGSNDLEHVELAIFRYNPDMDVDGVVDSFNGLIISENISLIEAESSVSLELNIGLNFSKYNRIWVVVDPHNSINESDELNNMIPYSFETYHSKGVVPEFPLPVGILIIVLILLIHVRYKKKRK